MGVNQWVVLQRPPRMGTNQGTPAQLHTMPAELAGLISVQSAFNQSPSLLCIPRRVRVQSGWQDGLVWHAVTNEIVLPWSHSKSDFHAECIYGGPGVRVAAPHDPLVGTNPASHGCNCMANLHGFATAFGESEPNCSFKTKLQLPERLLNLGTIGAIFNGWIMLKICPLTSARGIIIFPSK